MVTFRELAQRLVQDGVVKTMSHQRISQIRRADPGFPPATKVGPSWVVDYREARPYFENRKLHPGKRTDLEVKRKPPTE